MALYKMTEWESTCSHQWYCNDVSNLAHGSGEWYHAARACNLTPAAFIEMLVKDFHPDKIQYFKDKNVLVYSWNNQVDMRKLKNYVNKQARLNNYQI